MMVTPVKARREFLRFGCAAALTVGHRPVSALTRRVGRTQIQVVPPAYVRAATSAQVPARLLYAIALQESAMAFGDQVLPWPWTLCVRGTPLRYATYRDAVRCLAYAVEHGIRNVDCGPMQINWNYHSEKLGTYEQALDAYRNLAIGAFILSQQYAKTQDWHKATGAYHNMADAARAINYANGVFARLPNVALETTT